LKLAWAALVIVENRLRCNFIQLKVCAHFSQVGHAGPRERAYREREALRSEIRQKRVASAAP
jgi:hypothetical protein